MDCPLCGSSKTKKDRMVIKQYVLKKCKNCGFVFFEVDAKAAESANTGYGEADLENYDIQQTSADTIWFEKIAKKLIKKSGLRTGKVLDVGCGSGMLLNFFKKFGWEVHGVDPSGWSKPFAEFYGFPLYPCRIQDLTGYEEYFDIIVSTSTLEHLSYPKEFVDSTFGKLKKGGLLYISGVPNYRSLTKRLGLSWFRHNHPLHHVSFFSPESARFLFKSYPMHSLKVGTYGISGFYTAFSIIINVLKRKKRKKVETPFASNEDIPKTAIKNSSINIRQKEIRGAKRVLFRLITFFFEKIRLPGCGDKIEVLVKK